MNNTYEKNTNINDSNDSNEKKVEFYKSRQNNKNDAIKITNNSLENHNAMKEQIIEFYKSRQNKKFEKLENTIAYRN